MNVPPKGLTTDAVVTEVIDGDTVEVEISRRVRVRLIDCWAPETRGPERPVGLKAEAHLVKLLEESENRVTLHIPASVDGDIQDVFTMGRVLGHIWPAAGGDSLSKQMVRDGFACKRKPTK